MENILYGAYTSTSADAFSTTCVYVFSSDPPKLGVGVSIPRDRLENSYSYVYIKMFLFTYYVIHPLKADYMSMYTQLVGVSI